MRKKVVIVWIFLSEAVEEVTVKYLFVVITSRASFTCIRVGIVQLLYYSSYIIYNSYLYIVDDIVLCLILTYCVPYFIYYSSN